MAKPIISCVVDNQPKFHMQVWNWLLTLKGCGCFETLRPVVHHIGPPPTYLAETIEYFGADMQVIAPFGTGHAVYCNKLQQIDPLLLQAGDDFILCDTDLAFAACPSKFIDHSHCRAKIVDLPSPPPELVRTMLDMAGFESAGIDAQPSFSDGPKTHALNCNGGLYLIPRTHLMRMNTVWKKWSCWCLKQASILNNLTVHADQLGFMLMMIELDLPFNPLPEGSNFPVHFNPEKYAGWDDTDLTVLHYHKKLTEKGQLIETGVRFVDRQITSINAVLSSEHSNRHYMRINEAFQNRLVER